jgi:hypothetical protein
MEYKINKEDEEDRRVTGQTMNVDNWKKSSN